MLKTIGEYAGVYAVILAIVFVLVMLFPGSGNAQWEMDTMPPTAHERYHHYYKDWLQPVPPNEYGRVPTCCSATEYTIEGRHHAKGDCEPTRAELRDDGWYAELPPYSTRSERWVRIPDHKIIRQTNPEPDAAHLCWLEPGRDKDASEGVLCFLPPFSSF